MLTEKDYCDYETSVALKELGYKVPTSAYYMPHHKDLIWVSNPFRGGYVIDCFYSHNSLPKDVMTANFIDAPTLWEAQKWLREERDIHIEVFFSLMDDKKQLHYDWHIVHNIRFDDDEYTYDCDVLDSIGSYKSYEEALSEGIKEAVKILKEE